MLSMYWWPTDVSKQIGILVTLNICHRQMFSVTAYTAADNWKWQLFSFASIIEFFHCFFLVVDKSVCRPFLLIDCLIRDLD